MGISSSEELSVPFTHKNSKIKGLELLRGPTQKNKFIVLDLDEMFDAETPPIKFRYNTECDDDWVWEWTVHPDESIWYSVKGEYYEIPQTDLNKHPYNLIVDHSKMVPVQHRMTFKHSTISEYDFDFHVEGQDDDKDDDDAVVDNNDEYEDYHDDDDEYNYNECDDNKQGDLPSTELASSSPNSNYSFDPRIPRYHVPLPPIYDRVRRILAKKDPIPPHVLNQYNLLRQDVYSMVIQSGLINTKSIKCRFATKDLGSNGIGSKMQKHPVLMFFEQEPKKPDDVVWVLHLIKDTRIQKAAVEFDPKCWNKFTRRGWTVSDEIVELDDISLSDIAKWSVQYEKRNPDYTELYYNCRKFMLELSQFINVNWDEILMMEKIWYSMPRECVDDKYPSKSKW